MAERSPRARRHARTREAILQAARELIVERGPDGISLREIARRIDYSPAAIYEYFGSVQEIIKATCLEGLALFKGALDRVPVDLPIPKRLVEIGMAYLAFAQDHPDHFLLLFTRLVSGTLDIDGTFQTDSAYAVLMDCVREGLEQGVFHTREGYDLPTMCYHCWSLVHGMAMLRSTHLRHFEADFDTQHRRILEVLVDSLQQ